jgi:hypothetical protein
VLATRSGGDAARAPLHALLAAAPPGGGRVQTARPGSGAGHVEPLAWGHPCECEQVLATRSGGERRVHYCTPSRGSPGECEQDGRIQVGDVILANDMKDPLLQGQAFEKIFSAGNAAVGPILEFVEKKGANALILQFTQRFSEFKDPRMEDLLAKLIDDKLFFWRPAATWALAELAPRRYLELFRRSLGDHLWGVRQAAILGLDQLEDRDSIPAIKPLLADDIHAVRSQAARTLAAFGDESGLPVLVAALRDTTHWFDIDYGQLAREDAFNFLRRYSGMDFGFRPWESADQREKPLAHWEAWIASKFSDWKERVPKTAWPRPDTSEYLFGFELRSCQKGDFFFRVTTDGVLVLGYFNLVREKLDPGQLRAFKEAWKPAWEIDPFQTYGRSGCDFEKYYLRAEDGHYETPCFFVQGRPGRLDGFIKSIREILRSRFGDGTASELQERAELFREPE